MSKNPVKIIGIGGSLGSSYSTGLAALKCALEGAEREGAEVKCIDIALLDFPMYAEMDQNPQHIVDFAEEIYQADALILSSPLYHGSVSGLMKNVLDWLEVLHGKNPPYLAYKPVGLICVAGGAQALQGINAMEQIVRALRGWTIPFVVPVLRSWQIFKPDNSVTDAKVLQQLHSLGKEVKAAAERFSDT